MVDTEGRRLLIEVLKDPAWSQEKIGDALGLRQSAVSLWKRGMSRPEHHHRLVLQQIVGIDPMSWLTDEERQKVERAVETARTNGTAG